jgi:hypothetical protein
MAATLMRNRRLKQGLMCLDFSIRTYGGLLVEYLGVRQAHRSGAG